MAPGALHFVEHRWNQFAVLDWGLYGAGMGEASATRGQEAVVSGDVREKGA
jgi:hypothetical protein